jgi:hypothetical protein
MRDGLVKAIARRHGIDAERLYSGVDEPDPSGQSLRSLPRFQSRTLPAVIQGGSSRASTLLEARHLRRSFGGVVAVQDVSFAVRAGETVGLIGPNGAGKTTTFELLGGFTRPDRGSVVFDRRDVSLLSPEDRARLGLIRSFQDAALFPTMTVEQTVMVALERVQPTPFLTSTLGVQWGERKKERRAQAIVTATNRSGSSPQALGASPRSRVWSRSSQCVFSSMSRRRASRSGRPNSWGSSSPTSRRSWA